MGLETALNFRQIGDKVASTGDFVLISSEVNPVVSTRRYRTVDRRAAGRGEAAIAARMASSAEGRK